MQANRIVFPVANQALLEPVQIADEPGPGELLLKARTSAISPGTELIVFTGRHSALSDPNAAWPKFPFQAGYSYVGEIMRANQVDAAFQVGQRVFCRARHASACIIDPGRMATVPVPESVSDEQAAFAALVAISMNGVRLAKLELGETVVVIGLGLIGQFAAQLAHVAGAGQVIGSDLIASRREVALRSGMSRAVDPQQESLKDIVLALTDNQGADVVIEATGNPNVVPAALELLRPMGRLELLGSPHGTVQMDLYKHIHRSSVTIIGAHEGSAGRIEGPFPRWTNRANLKLVLQLMAQGRIRIDELITDIVRPADAPAMYEKLGRSRQESLGVVIDWR
jgi:2-desacetyl-2-hydroxyethyl bacteriochlorophyllide A dehydrogenase